MHYTYMLKCKDNTYYTGYTNNLVKRVQAHNEGKGAKYTRGRGPVELVYYEEYEDKQTAMRREWEIKQLIRSEKEIMIQEWKIKQQACNEKESMIWEREIEKSEQNTKEKLRREQKGTKIGTEEEPK